MKAVVAETARCTDMQRSKGTVLFCRQDRDAAVSVILAEGCHTLIIIFIIIIMEICKAPTLWLKALNKHSITHIMYINVEMLSAIKMCHYQKKENADI